MLEKEITIGHGLVMEINNTTAEEQNTFVKTASVCVVAYNEERYLPALLEDIVMQTYPSDMIEVILVDGSSDDRTKTIMNGFAARYRDRFIDIKVLDNEKRIQSAGWNIAIRASRADVIFRIDAHAHLEPDFVENNMRDQNAGEMITGGPRECIIIEGNPWRKMLLMVENSLFGSSISESRRQGEKKYVKSMFHAAYRREVFEKAGLFDEGLLRTEDNELHYRMRQAGCRFLFDPQIRSYQYARPDLKKMIKQKYGNGFWIGTTLKICPGCLSVYHFVPALFVIAIIITAAAALCGLWQPAALMWALYAAFAVFSTVLGIVKEGFHLSYLAAPAVFLILHVSYGTGTVLGLLTGKKHVSS